MYKKEPRLITVILSPENQIGEKYNSANISKELFKTLNFGVADKLYMHKQEFCLCIYYLSAYHKNLRYKQITKSRLEYLT